MVAVIKPLGKGRWLTKSETDELIRRGSDDQQKAELFAPILKKLIDTPARPVPKAEH